MISFGGVAFELELTVIAYLVVFFIGFIGGYCLKDLMDESIVEEAKDKIQEYNRKEDYRRRSKRRYL